MAPEATDELLRGSPVLRFLPENQRTELIARFKPARYDFGDLIVSEGEEADAFYFLTLGRARVIKKTEKGGELVLAALRPGSEFGDAALLDGGRCTASVRCSTAVEVLRLGREDFLALLPPSGSRRSTASSTNSAISAACPPRPCGRWSKTWRPSLSRRASSSCARATRPAPCTS